MTFDYSLAAIVPPAFSSTSPTLCSSPSGSERRTTMTVIGWIQILIYCAIIVAITPVLGGYMTQRLQRRADIPVAGPAPGRGGDLQDRRRRRAARARLAHVYRRHAAVPRRRLSHSLCVDAPAGGAAVQSGRAIRRRRRLVVQHGDELHHQHQLAELRRRKHDVLSRADARADAPELSVGGDRHRARHRADPRLCPRLGQDRSAISGSMSRAARSMSCCRSACPTRCSWSGKAFRRRSAPMSMPRRWKAPSRPSRSARSPRRSRSRCSAPMAAASSTPMPRIRSKIRPRCRTTCRSSRSSRSARR